MKILYAFNGTGFGHASRATSIIPILKQHYEVDILVSGELNPIEIGHKIKYRKRGFTFVYDNGGVSYLKTLLKLNIFKFIKDLLFLPVKEYDLIISDFEPISAYAAKLRGVPSLALSHHAAFLSELTPRPVKVDKVAEWILKNYAPCDHNIGFHFKKYDSFILNPHVRKEIKHAKTRTKKGGYILVYLSAYNVEDLIKVFNDYPNYNFRVVSSKTRGRQTVKNVEVSPAHPITFMHMLINCNGVITGGGFETVAEALYLDKKVLSIPIANQYEQQCNAKATGKIKNGYTGTFSPVVLKHFLIQTLLDTPAQDFKVSTDEEVLEAIQKVINEKI